MTKDIEEAAKQEELEQRVQALEKALIHLQEDSRQNHQISEKIITKLENIYRVLGMGEVDDKSNRMVISGGLYFYNLLYCKSNS